MLRKSLIALAATAALAGGVVATTASAEAKTVINVGVGFGGFGYGYGGYGYGYGGYYNPAYYDSGYYSPENCGVRWVHRYVWNWNHTAKYWVNKKVYTCY